MATPNGAYSSRSPGRCSIPASPKPLHVLVVGAYGFIGAAVARELSQQGHRVTGLGRSARTGQRLLPTIAWIECDLADMNRDRWLPLLDGMDVVINAAGVLQDGARDDVRAVQDRAIQALIAACERAARPRYVQISAVGAHVAASTRFLRTKARADRRLQESGLDWIILRPGLVIGRGAYGGTALLRMLAALPWAQPLVMGNARIQCVSLAELAVVVARAAAGELPRATQIDLVEPQPHALRDIVAAMRAWLGFAPVRWQWELPGWFGRWVAAGADLLGHLGWRSPLRSTALRNLETGVVGDPQPAGALLGQPLMSLEQILADMPTTVQDRWFARLYLALPLSIATLAAFWILSGLIALTNLPQAAAVLGAHPSAATLVIVASAVDIGLGLAVLYRPWAAWACWGMVAATLAYLLAATVYAPELWLDPLGPLLKPIPAMLLALITPALLVER